jgi:mRNA-degrading endonuclease RelE of RelBE toxin-antitoxin system
VKGVPKRGKAAPRKPARRAPAAAPPPLPPEGWDAPLHELERDALSVFLYVALVPEETAELVKALGLSQPGFRQESLGDVQRCDLLADEVRAVPERREPVLAMLRKALERPVLGGWPLGPEAAADLLDACTTEAAAALALWRVLCDPEPGTRARAKPFLEALAKQYYGPAPSSGGGRRAPAAEDPLATARKEADDLRRKLADAEGRAGHAEARAEGARKKGEEAREKLNAWLKEARAREAQAVDEAARAREASEAARRELARVEAELQAARAQDAAVEAARLRGAVKDLEARAGALEGRLERAKVRERELEEELSGARAAAGAAGSAPEPGPAAGEGVYTREFYDSLDGWDRRVQRAAFKQAALLAQDHRHPSLRALPLEGLPGYYRVRVATDVRLLYRRTERQNTIEILSLIDREDLDRYIKQAKTR